MAVIRMQKVAVISHASVKEQLIDALHKEGIMEIAESKNPVNIDHTEINFRAAELKFAIETLKNFASKETLSVIRKPASERDIIHAARHTDVRGIIDRLSELEEEDTEAERAGKEALKLSDVLEPWIPLPYALNIPRETGTTLVSYGTIPKVKLTGLIKDVSAIKLGLGEVNNIAGIAYCTAHIWKDDAKRFDEISTRNSWSSIELPILDGTARGMHEQAMMRFKETQQVRAKNAKERSLLSVELPNLVKTAKFLSWLDEKQGAREAMSSTSETFTLLGWVPRQNLQRLEQRLKDTGPAIALLKIKPDEGENPPVALWNKTAVAPFESVTNLYGLPGHSEFDPTASLAPFFALYFALCLTDAGYGAVLAAVFGTAIYRRKLKIRESRLAWTLFIAGIVTVVVSIPFGGYFGLSPSQVPSFFTKTTTDGELLFKGQIWNLSEQSGINFLQNLALVLGLTHLFYGMFLAGLHKWIHGKKAEAFWVNFTPHILLGSILLYVLRPTSEVLYILYATIIILIWGKGYGFKWFLRPIMGAVGTLNFAVGLLSNTLSYLRILALGLVTGAIAMAVNQVAIEVGKLLPIFLAIPAIILIFCMGHLISIALNTLGSFIHSGRLQFIEFFSQFFEGGGRAFKPFRRSTV